MLDTTTRVHVIQTGPSMAQGDISTPKALHSVKGAQLNPDFILRYMGAAIKTCTIVTLRATRIVKIDMVIVRYYTARLPINSRPAYLMMACT